MIQIKFAAISLTLHCAAYIDNQFRKQKKAVQKQKFVNYVIVNELERRFQCARRTSMVVIVRVT